MKYLTGIHALNLPCELETCGDWHLEALQWGTLQYKESEDIIYKDYGIEKNKYISKINKTVNVANHIRALLDLILDGNFAEASGMNKDFICNDKYNNEIFDKVSELYILPEWVFINKFMAKEYGRKWIKYIKKKNLWEI